jgi:hypothetical protein
LRIELAMTFKAVIPDILRLATFSGHGRPRPSKQFRAATYSFYHSMPAFYAPSVREPRYNIFPGRLRSNPKNHRLIPPSRLAIEIAVDHFRQLRKGH